MPRNKAKAVLTSKLAILSKYRGASKFKIWKELEAGDTLELSIVIDGSYTRTWVSVKNPRTDTIHDMHANKLSQYLSKVDFIND